MVLLVSPPAQQVIEIGCIARWQVEGAPRCRRGAAAPFALRSRRARAERRVTFMPFAVPRAVPLAVVQQPNARRRAAPLPPA